MDDHFADLSEQDKKMLDSFAGQILQLQTPSFIEFYRRGGLGTGDSFYISTSEPT